MRVALAQMNPIIGSLAYNRDKILKNIQEARKLGADLVIFPEMALCGYPPEDLLNLPSFVKAVEEELQNVISGCEGIVAIVGCVRENPYGGEKGLYNSAAIIENGELVGFQDKSLLPDYDVFSERRYFEPAARVDVWSVLGKRVAVTICEDIWQHAHAVEYSSYPRDPVSELQSQAPDLLVNLSASPYYLGRNRTRLTVCEKTAETLKCPTLFCNQVGGNDSLIFDGCSLVLDSQGKLIQFGKSFEEDLLFVDLEKRYPVLQLKTSLPEEMFQALVLGVRDYFHKLGFSKACFGLSGGIDSALVACIAAEALGKENILVLGLPTRYSSKGSIEDSKELAAHLGITFKEISIEPLFQSFLKTLEPHFEGKQPDITEENLQARIRGTLLMAFSNKFNYLLLSPGNKSEMAMGYVTLYGDMCGGLGVLSDVTKEQVYILARWINRTSEIIPQEILDKPPSAELKENQKDTDSLPEYPIVDRVLQHYVEDHWSPEEIAKKYNYPLSQVKTLIRRIHLSEYKRRQAPPGLRVTKKAFTVGRKFPIVQHWNL